MTRTLDVIGNQLSNLGFHKFAIGQGFHSSDFDYLTTLDADWQDHYFAKGFQQIDPLPYCALSNQTPVTWSALRRRMKHSPVMNDAADFGMTKGFALSCGGYIISALSDEDHSLSDLNYIHDTIKAITRDNSPSFKPLTDQQQGLVDLMAAGLTRSDISKILGVSLNTVKSMKARLFKNYKVTTTCELLRVLRNL